MTNAINRDTLLPAPCGKCGHEFRETLRRLEQNPKLTCPSCGTINQFNADDLSAKLKEVDRIMSDFSKKISTKITIKF